MASSVMYCYFLCHVLLPVLSAQAYIHFNSAVTTQICTYIVIRICMCTPSAVDDILYHATPN